MKKRTRNFVVDFLMVIGLVIGGGLGYVSDSYAPDEIATQALETTASVTVEEKEKYRAFRPTAAMAASYIKTNADEFAGLILLAAYATDDLSATDLPVLSIYGTRDEVLNFEKYQANKDFVPQIEEVIIEGGNHAQFGHYGVQWGDGTAGITAVEQEGQTVAAIIDFIKQEKD